MLVEQICCCVFLQADEIAPDDAQVVLKNIDAAAGTHETAHNEQCTRIAVSQNFGEDKTRSKNNNIARIKLPFVQSSRWNAVPEDVGSNPRCGMQP